MLLTFFTAVRHGSTLAVVTMGLLAGPRLFAAQSPPSSSLSTQHMKTLELTAALDREEIVIGESISLRISAVNGGSAPAEIPDRLSPAEFDVIFRRSGQSGVYTVANEAAAMKQRSTENLPSLVTSPSSLPPGEKAAYQIDPAGFLTEPLSPGAYLVSVAFGQDAERIESAGVALRVVAARPSDFATVVQPRSQRVGLAMVHLATAQRSTVVLSSLSGPENPYDGVFYRRVEASAPEVVTSVAIMAQDSGAARQVWTAWLQSNCLVAGISQGSSWQSAGRSEPLGLRSASLHRIGWKITSDKDSDAEKDAEPAPESALFAALGIDVQGRCTLVLAHFSKAFPVALKLVPLEGTHMPALWKLSYRGGEDGGKLVLVTADVTDNKTRVVAQTISLTGEIVSPPVVLLERVAPLLALSLDAVDGSLPVADVLVGPADGKTGVTLLRCALSGEGQPMEWNAAFPEMAAGAQPSAWTLTSRPLSDPVVAVKNGDKLQACHLVNPKAWTLIADQSAGADHLRLEVLRDVPWAIWADATTGIKQAAVR